MNIRKVKNGYVVQSAFYDSQDGYAEFVFETWAEVLGFLQDNEKMAVPNSNEEDF